MQILHENRCRIGRLHGNTHADVFRRPYATDPDTSLSLAERLFRTLKEQAVHGRVFQTIDDVRDAVRAFVARYNAAWLIEKNGHRSPAQMRAARQEQTLKRAA